MSVQLNPKNRGDLNPLLKWLWDLLSLFSVEEITIPTDFPQQISEIKSVLRSDVSGIVNSILDFAIDCALVDYQIETNNENLTKILNSWLFGVNEDLRGRIPTGIKALAKEYFRERWKGGSLLLLRTEWHAVDKLILPTKLWFVDGINIKVENGKDDEIRVIGEEKYSLKVSRNEYKQLPRNKDELIFVQKPYSNWSSLYPTPFLIQRGIYKNLKVFELINKKSEKIIAKAVEYLLLLRKGSEQLALKGIPQFIYSEDDLKKVKESLQTTLTNTKTEAGTPSYVTNFDTEVEHLIPEYSKALNEGLYSPIEKRILAGLGLVEIVQGVASTRRESILNPKPFIGEIQRGIEDFKSLLIDVLKTIAEKNTSHRKYFNSDIQIHASPIKAFITEDIRAHLRSMYDRGCLSKQTYMEIVGDNIDFTIEVQRRKNETGEGLDEILYPPITQNTENKPADLSPFIDKDIIPDDKKGLEKINYKAMLEIEPYDKTDAEFLEALEEFGRIYEEAPYKTNNELPSSVKKYAQHAQTIFRLAFNNALEKYKNETTAFKVAWAALKKYLNK